MFPVFGRTGNEQVLVQPSLSRALSSLVRKETIFAAAVVQNVDPKSTENSERKTCISSQHGIMQTTVLSYTAYRDYDLKYFELTDT